MCMEKAALGELAKKIGWKEGNRRVWGCPICHRAFSLLLAIGKIISLDGYAQCADCRADVDYISNGD